MKEWKSVIGFSGTISYSTIAQIRAELKDPLCIEIQSLRKNANNNKVSKVIKVNEAQLNKAIADRIKELSTTCNNFIIVFNET